VANLKMAAESARRQDPAAQGRQTAASWLRAAIEVIEGEGPSLKSQLFGDQDPQDWREEQARRYMAKARLALRARD